MRNFLSPPASATTKPGWRRSTSRPARSGGQPVRSRAHARPPREPRAGHGRSRPFEWIVGEYNDAEGAGLIAERAHDLAAVIVEPVQGAAGVIPGNPAFLLALREATATHGVLLVFDEVMTAGLAPGGMQEVLGIDPDLTTLAKFVGGGLAFGAFGGRAELMSRFDPSRPDALQHGGPREYAHRVLGSFRRTLLNPGRA